MSYGGGDDIFTNSYGGGYESSGGAFDTIKIAKFGRGLAILLLMIFIVIMFIVGWIPASRTYVPGSFIISSSVISATLLLVYAVSDYYVSPSGTNIFSRSWNDVKSTFKSD